MCCFVFQAMNQPVDASNVYNRCETLCKAFGVFTVIAFDSKKKSLSWKHNAMQGQCLNPLNVHRVCLLIYHQRQTGHLGYLSYSDLNDKNNFISRISPRQFDEHTSCIWEAIRSRVSYSVLSATYQEQASRGHIQSNAALIAFAIFWTGPLSRYSVITNAGKQYYRALWSNGSTAGKPANP